MRKREMWKQNCGSWPHGLNARFGPQPKSIHLTNKQISPGIQDASHKDSRTQNVTQQAFETRDSRHGRKITN